MGVHLSEKAPASAANAGEGQVEQVLTDTVSTSTISEKRR